MGKHPGKGGEVPKVRTKLVKIESRSYKELINGTILDEAADLIRKGEVVAFPTETVYGLGASCFSVEGIRKIFEIKGRPQDNPLIVHISDLDMLKMIASEVPEIAPKLTERFWPGPLTILFKRSGDVPEEVTAGLPTIAVRMPSHPVARALIHKAGVPIAAPSANLSGFPSPTTAEHVYNDLNGRVPLIIDGGPCDIGVESTVIDLFHDPPLILRPGGLNYEDLREVIPELEIYRKKSGHGDLENRPPSPGMKYRHYSPEKPVILIEGSSAFIKSVLSDYISNIPGITADIGKNHKYLKDTGLEVTVKAEINVSSGADVRLGLIHTHPEIDPSVITGIKGFKLEEDCIIRLFTDDSRFPSEDVVARGIFAALRRLDLCNVDVIVVEGIQERKKGLAVMNRLRKAASIIIKEV